MGVGPEVCARARAHSSEQERLSPEVSIVEIDAEFVIAVEIS